MAGVYSKPRSASRQSARLTAHLVADPVRRRAPHLFARAPAQDRTEAELRADARLAERLQEVTHERVVVDPRVGAVLVLDRERHHREVVLLRDMKQSGEEGKDAGPAAGRAFGKGRERESLL